MLRPPGTFIVGTIHPAALLRDQTNQIAVLSDLRKAVRVQADGPTLIPACYRQGNSMPDWSIYPDVEHVREWLTARRGLTLSLDLESTYQGQIMCLAMWPVEDALADQGICIPFYRKGGERYWPMAADLEVKRLLFGMLKDRDWPKIGQNFIGFDAPLIKKVWDITVEGIIADLMVAHWQIMPEMPHGLAFISSMFTDLPPYKIEVHEVASEEKDDVDKWENVLQYEDRPLRVYCMEDTFVPAVTWPILERIMSDASTLELPNLSLAA